ncbi:MAG: helix-turn-helix domain-containing protein [Elusimicrobiota bacterium]|nr:helix-turn-helix domain-containing protein [Elusimicrobiota bacterium]
MDSLIQKLSSGKTEVNDPSEIGKIVRHLRKTANLTQIETAAMCKVGVRFISDLENGKSSLHLGKVFRVLKNFGLKVLLTKKENEND